MTSVDTDQRHRATCATAVALLWSLHPAGAVPASKGGDPAWEMLRQVLPSFDLTALPNEPNRRYGELSPDGQRSAYIHMHELAEEGMGTANRSLRLSGVEGELIRGLTAERFRFCPYFTWSQTSDALFFWVDRSLEEDPANGGCWKVNTRDGRITRPHFPWLPEFTLPICSTTTADYLAVESRQTAEGPIHSTIYHVNLKSGSRRRLAEGYRPVWSPEGRRIAYSKAIHRQIAIDNEWWVIQKDGTGHRRLISDEFLEREARRRAWELSHADGPFAWIAGTDQALVGGGRVDAKGQSESGVWAVEVPAGTPRWIAGIRLLSASRDGRAFLVSRQQGGKRPEARYLLRLRNSGHHPPRAY